jgi:solute carrier family 35 (UDP-sugar transporter), member A1/2/3
MITIAASSREERKKIFGTWTLSDSLKVAAIPAVMYAIQNELVQHAYQYIDSMTFNLINQTKVRTA